MVPQHKMEDLKGALEAADLIEEVVDLQAEAEGVVEADDGHELLL